MYFTVCGFTLTLTTEYCRWIIEKKEVSYMDYMIEQFSNMLINERENKIYEHFEKYGYSKSWILENLDRVSASTEGNTVTYMVDKIPLFNLTIVEKNNYENYYKTKYEEEMIFIDLTTSQ